MNSCLVHISIGELYDKYTILEIKYDKIKDVDKLKMINTEKDYLKVHIDKYNDLLDLHIIIEELKKINEILWDIEDAIREKEKKQEFDSEFINLARSVYKTNDKRSIIKKQINQLLQSEIVEIKSYLEYK